MQIQITASERWPSYMLHRRDLLERGVQAGVKAAGEGLKTELRGHVAARLTGRIANAIGVRVYPLAGASLAAAAVVAARGQKADTILTAHRDAATIRSRFGRALAIPTSHVPRTRGQGRGGTRRMSPSELESAFNRDLRFARLGTRDRRVLGVLIMDQVVGSRSGRGYVPGTKRRLRTRSTESVVMFVLMREVRLRRRLAPEAIAQRWVDQVPALIERALPAEA